MDTNHDRELFVVYVPSTNRIMTLPVQYCFSQNTAPTSFLVNLYAGWFDTSTNTVKFTTDGGSNWTICSLPFCLGRPGESHIGWNGYLDQVFNGFGYIGSTVFALPGVKGLIPNGRNADGSLKNDAFELNEVITRTFTSNTTVKNDIFPITKTQQIGAGKYELNETENYLIETTSGVIYTDRCIAMKADVTSGVISNFTSKTPFHAVDYNDSPTISGWSMPSSRYIDLTLGASGATYTAPANGWVYLRKSITSVGQYIICRQGTAITVGWGVLNNNQAYVLHPVNKGLFVVNYNAAGTNVEEFRFIYAEGEN